MSAALKDLGDHIAAVQETAVRDTVVANGELTITIHRDRIVDMLRFLRDDPTCRFTTLIDICGVDWPGDAERFEVVYHLLAPETLARVRVKARVPADAPEASSVCAIWPAANWMEREVFDLYGIRFAGHPDLRRLLLYDEFEGHPLRKDYPKTRRQPLIGPGG